MVNAKDSNDLVAFDQLRREDHSIITDTQSRNTLPGSSEHSHVAGTGVGKKVNGLLNSSNSPRIDRTQIALGTPRPDYSSDY